MLTKVTRRLFMGAYQYKLVLVCAGAGWFRGGDWDSALDMLKRVDLSSGSVRGIGIYGNKKSQIKSQDELDYAFKLLAKLKSVKDIVIRVESPWISIYSNSKSSIDSIINIDHSKVKYVCVPPHNTALNSETIIMPKINYDYRVTLGKTTQDHSAFIQWAEKNTKVKLTKACKRELARNMSWGGTYFYITGDNNLLLAKMHLGHCINKVERIVKA